MNLFNCDCMDVLKKCDDDSFDLAIVDVPYGIGESGAKNKTRTGLAKSTDYKAFHGNDSEPPSDEYFTELFRVSKNQIIFGANHFISKIPFDSPCWLVWDKQNGKNDFADAELAWTSFNSAVRVFRFRWQGMLQGNMKEKEHRIHPTQKPVALYRWILNRFSKAGDTILDTHLGSGSIAIACHYMNRHLTGCEIDKHYFDKMIERIDKETRQLELF